MGPWLFPLFPGDSQLLYFLRHTQKSTLEDRAKCIAPHLGALLLWQGKRKAKGIPCHRRIRQKHRGSQRARLSQPIPPCSVALPFSVPLSHGKHLSSQGMCRCLPKYCSQTFPWHSVGSWVSQPPPTSKALQVLSHVQCRQH